VTLRTDGWSSGPVVRARSFRDRLLGLKRADVDAVLIRTRSVHGLGLTEPFLAVGLTHDLGVRMVRRVYPGRVARFPGCVYVLELSCGSEPPEPGSTLEIEIV